MGVTSRKGEGSGSAELSMAQASEVENDSTVAGTNVDDALDTLSTAAGIANSSKAPGTTLEDTLNLGAYKIGGATGVNATTTATPTLCTVPAGKTLVVLGYVLRVTAASSPTGTPNVGIGVAAGEDDIVAAGTVAAPTTAGNAIFVPATGAQKLATAAQVVKFGINTAHSGGTATWAIDLIGYLI